MLYQFILLWNWNFLIFDKINCKQSKDFIMSLLQMLNFDLQSNLFLKGFNFGKGAALCQTYSFVREHILL